MGGGGPYGGATHRLATTTCFVGIQGYLRVKTWVELHALSLVVRVIHSPELLHGTVTPANVTTER